MSEEYLAHRAALASDLAEVCSFVRNAGELFYAYPRANWPLTLEQLSDAFEQRQGSTLALLDGRPAGFANFYQTQAGECCALGNLMIAPWARGRGVAQYLIGVMERLAQRDFLARQLKAGCFNGNTAAMLLYARLGYVVDAVVERQHTNGDRVALVQFVKHLQS